jgi:hypothetical protein
LSQVTQTELIVEGLDGLVFQLQPVLPFEARIFVERPLGLMFTEAAVNLPGNELRMITECLGHVFDKMLGGIPISVVVKANCVARAFVLDQTVFVER